MFRIFSRPASIIDHPLAEAVAMAIREAQSYAASHGGQILLVGITAENVVQIRLKGACAFCPLADITVRNAVERRIRELVPEVVRVKVVG